MMSKTPEFYNSLFDVVVVGGGPAGLVAATQSAAAGAKTLLVERSSLLGGTTTSGGVNFPGLFHAWGRQIIAGYGWQLVTRCVTESGQTLPDFSTIPSKHWHHQILLDRALYTLLCDEMVVDAGAEIRFHTLPARVDRLESGWRVELCGKNGIEVIETAFLIDCTGDANVVSLAGGKVCQAGEDQQPGTQVCRASGYDLANLDLVAINSAFHEAMKRGEVDAHDVGWSATAPNVGNWLKKRGENANHISGINARDSRGRSEIELAGRKSILRLYRFLRKQPGLEQLHIDYLAPECGVRETVTVVGDVTITLEDYVAGRYWPDALSYAFYPIDLHSSIGSGLKKHELEIGVVPVVPRAALLPEGLDRIAVAGRCVSSDHAANSALRVQAASMGMGQAAAALTIVALRNHCNLRAANLDSVRALLRSHGAIVPKD